MDKNGKLESYTTWHIGRIEIGAFLRRAVVHFLGRLAGMMFLIVVKLFGTMQLLSPDSDTPTTKECPYCLSVIPIAAVKCAHCTADLAETVDSKPDPAWAGAGKG